jgi:hypothetical protein
MQTQQEQDLARLREEIESVVGRKMKTPKDFDFLAGQIFDKLHENVSSTTLKRIWGYLSEPSTPRLSTLDLLAQFIDYKDWDAFCSQEPQTSPSSPQEETASPSRRSRNPLYIALFALVAVVAISLIFFSRSSKPETDPSDNKYVISIGDYFNNPYEYLRLFGVTGPQPYIWDITMPHHPALKLWGPTYHHPYWHNDGDSAKMLPTIEEYYLNPEKPIEVSIMRNIAQYWLYLRINEIRLAFVKNLVDTGYVFTGAYRMSLEHSDTTHILWERVADEVDLEHLEYLENLRN